MRLSCGDERHDVVTGENHLLLQPFHVNASSSLLSHAQVRICWVEQVVDHLVVDFEVADAQHVLARRRVVDNAEHLLHRERYDTGVAVAP